MSRVVTRRAVSFIISDFQAADYEQALRIAGRRHDVIAVTITDPREVDLPNVGFIELEDAETGETILIDTSDPVLRRSFTESAGSLRSDREKLLQK